MYRQENEQIQGTTQLQRAAGYAQSFLDPDVRKDIHCIAKANVPFLQTE